MPINNLQVGYKVAAFYQYQQTVPARILIVTRIRKASFWTDSDERWVLSNGHKHDRDKWSNAHVTQFTEADQSKWKFIKQRKDMERDLKAYADIAERLPLNHLSAVCAAIEACKSPAVVDREDPKGTTLKKTNEGAVTDSTNGIEF